MDKESIPVHLSPFHETVVGVAGLLPLSDQDVCLPDLPALEAPGAVVETARGGDYVLVAHRACLVSAVPHQVEVPEALVEDHHVTVGTAATVEALLFQAQPRLGQPPVRRTVRKRVLLEA